MSRSICGSSRPGLSRWGLDGEVLEDCECPITDILYSEAMEWYAKPKFY